MMYHVALTLHITGIVLLAGSIFMDFFFTRQFWKMKTPGQDDKITVVAMIEKIQKLMGAGGLLTILSGIWMISLVSAWTEQPWFHLKMGVLLLVLFNALFFRRKLGKPLFDAARGETVEERLIRLKNQLNTVQLSQIVLLIGMFVLSVFKFN